MTETQAARVLLVGKRARILDELGRALRLDGLHVREETDLRRVRDGVDGATVDVLALGRALTGGKRDDLVTAMRARNPHVKVVDGLAPIPALVVAQVHEALRTPPEAVRAVAEAVYEEAENRVVLVLRQAAEVEVTLHRLDPLYRAYEDVVYRGRLDRGRQHLPVAAKVGRGERFLVVRADSEISVHSIF